MPWRVSPPAPANVVPFPNRTQPLAAEAGSSYAAPRIAPNAPELEVLIKDVAGSAGRCGQRRLNILIGFDIDEGMFIELKWNKLFNKVLRGNRHMLKPRKWV